MEKCGILPSSDTTPGVGLTVDPVGVRSGNASGFDGFDENSSICLWQFVACHQQSYSGRCS
jgi:hypothetical protein